MSSRVKISLDFVYPINFRPLVYYPQKEKIFGKTENYVWSSEEVWSDELRERWKAALQSRLEGDFEINVVGSAEADIEFRVAPLNVLVADSLTGIGEWAILVKRKGNLGDCLERVYAQTKTQNISNSQIVESLSESLDLRISNMIARSCKEGEETLLGQKYYSFAPSFSEDPWTWVGNLFRDRPNTFQLVFFNSWNDALEALPKKMDYYVCVATASNKNGVRCVLTEKRITPEINWKSHFVDYSQASVRAIFENFE